MGIQAGGWVYLAGKSEQGRGKNSFHPSGKGDFFWNNLFYTGCMRSSNTGIPILYIDYQFSFYSSNHIQSSTAYFFSFACTMLIIILPNSFN